jgi:hypothetical protein
MSDTGRPGPERPAGPPTPPISNWEAVQQQPPTAPVPPASSGPAWLSAGAPAAGSPAAFAAQSFDQEPAADPTPPAESGRPRWLIPTIIGVVVLVLAAIIIGIVVSSKGDGDKASPAVATTILLPSPTPTVEPVARPATTAFAAALPATVLQYALATSVPDAEWQGAGAVEAYTETYTDGGSGTVTVRSGQWETPEEATAFAASLVAAFPAPAAPDPSASPNGPALPQSGEVTAGGAAAGTFSIADAGDGNGIAVWTNGTTVFQATAPVAQIVDLYNAFPL